MNSLSWMIYAADAVGGLDTAFAFAAGVAGACAAGSTMGYFLTHGEPTIWSREDPEKKRAGQAALNATLSKGAKWGVGICLAAIVAGAVTPSRDTIYAIAASEMGEKAMTSQTGGKAIQALNAWLDRQIKGGAAK